MRTSRWTLVLLIVGAVLGPGGDAWGKKGGGKPGGGGGGEDPGNTTPPDIVFYNRTDNELAVIQDDGTGVTSLPAAGRVYGRPDWSPDGSRIAFSSLDDPGIRVIDADGGNLRQVVTTNLPSTCVAWSPTAAPDGKTKLAFIDQPSGASFSGRRDIFLVNLDGSDLENLTEGWADSYLHRPRWVSWSPDGEAIVTNTEYDLRILDLKQRDADGHPRVSVVYSTYGVEPVNATSLTPGGPDWSRDGDSIAFGMLDDSNVHPLGDLFVMKVARSTTTGVWTGTTPDNVTETPDDAEAAPSWSPDSNEVVCWSQHWKSNRKGTATASFVVVPIRSGTRRTLHEDRVADPRVPCWKRTRP